LSKILCRQAGTEWNGRNLSTPGFEMDDAMQQKISPLPPISSSSVVFRAIADVAAALGVTLLLCLPIVVASGILTNGKAPLSARKFPVGFVMLFTLVQDSQFALFGWLRFRKNRSEGRNSASRANAGDAFKGRAILFGMAAGLGLVAVGGLFARIIDARTASVMAELLSGLRAAPWTAASVLVLIAAVGPVCEEVLFRGAIFGLAHSNGRTLTGAIMASVLFAIGHFSLRMMLYYLICSAVYCWLLARTKTMASPIAAHVTVNLSACVAGSFRRARLGRLPKSQHLAVRQVDASSRHKIWRLSCSRRPFDFLILQSITIESVRIVDPQLGSGYRMSHRQ
jgi:membrane protease YdiL (CAAX protease family)